MSEEKPVFTALDPLHTGLACTCPRCGQGRLFKHGFTLDVVDSCDVCGLALARNDSGDGPAVFLIFVLGFLLVPMALLADAFFTIPLWAHAVIWTAAAIAICVFTMRPLKAYVIALQFKHRPGSWEV